MGQILADIVFFKVLYTDYFALLLLKKGAMTNEDKTSVNGRGFFIFSNSDS